MRTELLNQVWASYAAQALLDATTLFGLVPEEILALSQLVSLRLGTLNGLQRIRVVTSIPRLSRYRHWCGREVLHLLQLEVQLFGLDRQLSHICLRASGMAGYEVGDNLLVQMLLTIDAVEDALEVIELLKRRFAHQVQHAVAGMFRSNFQSSADMTSNQLAGILHSRLVSCFVLALI